MAPLYSELSLGPQHHQQRKSYPSLRFRLFGPKLLVNTTQVSSNCKPIVGAALYLEGRKCNELSIHAQHLSNLPGMLSSSSSSRLSLWQSSEESGPGFTEPILWKSYHACTAAVKHNPKWFEMRYEPVVLDPGFSPDAPPVQVQSQKLSGSSTCREVTRGANNVPGHWLVTAAKAIKERVK
ncbi:hypothetical protein HPP92_005917 [Vanilla planifolia]|uniref:Uncharacterized protein n=1 Tax=Vanilla planifolia TaxID=51239 RepID=A0A835RQK4_VANPL|nr:hypothetical protein HPP92_006199 [Vanilla planifolia]KAG0494923.1 hypothetical protein HPP92_005917 [Vanilla planifolia]